MLATMWVELMLEISKHSMRRGGAPRPQRLPERREIGQRIDRAGHTQAVALVARVARHRFRPSCAGRRACCAVPPPARNPARPPPSSSRLPTTGAAPSIAPRGIRTPGPRAPGIARPLYPRASSAPGKWTTSTRAPSDLPRPKVSTPNFFRMKASVCRMPRRGRRARNTSPSRRFFVRVRRKRGHSSFRSALTSRKRLSSRETDIVAGAEFLDQPALEQERLRLAAGEMHSKSQIASSSARVFRSARIVRWREILAHPLAEVARLAYVDHPMKAIAHDIHARLVRHIAQLDLEIGLLGRRGHRGSIQKIGQ